MEFDDVSQDRTSNYGVCFEIQKHATNEVMWTHFHVHHDKDYKVVSAHFKVGMSKAAPQSWDLPRTDDLVAFIKSLRAKVGGSWTQIDSV